MEVQTHLPHQTDGSMPIWQVVFWLLVFLGCCLHDILSEGGFFFVWRLLACFEFFQESTKFSIFSSLFFFLLILSTR
jgi:hypothetical protein